MKNILTVTLALLNMPAFLAASTATTEAPQFFTHEQIIDFKAQANKIKSNEQAAIEKLLNQPGIRDLLVPKNPPNPYKCDDFNTGWADKIYPETVSAIKGLNQAERNKRDKDLVEYWKEWFSSSDGTRIDSINYKSLNAAVKKCNGRITGFSEYGIGIEFTIEGDSIIEVVFQIFAHPNKCYGLSALCYYNSWKDSLNIFENVSWAECFPYKLATNSDAELCDANYAVVYRIPTDAKTEYESIRHLCKLATTNKNLWVQLCKEIKTRGVFRDIYSGRRLRIITDSDGTPASIILLRAPFASRNPRSIRDDDDIRADGNQGLNLLMEKVPMTKRGHNLRSTLFGVALSALVAAGTTLLSR